MSESGDFDQLDVGVLMSGQAGEPLAQAGAGPDTLIARIDEAKGPSSSPADPPRARQPAGTETVTRVEP
ncbi:MAG TPA: hypothetical protein VGG16_25910 [Streptosporangiaceae bacterium]